jgi:hypothetical protein
MHASASSSWSRAAGATLTVEDFWAVDPDEVEALVLFLAHEGPALAASRDVPAIIGMVNVAFDREAAARLHNLPEDERPAVRERVRGAGFGGAAYRRW